MTEGAPSLHELRELDREECRLLLGSRYLGRVAVPGPDAPVVLPVCYALDGDAVVFQTGVGTKLDAAVAGRVVSFEVDDADPLFHRGWSVLVTGHASVVEDPAVLARIERLPVRRWVPGGPTRWVRVPLERVSGRRIVPRGSPLGASGPTGPTTGAARIDPASGDDDPAG